MIRSLVEGVFKRVLGEYVEELDKKSLNVSVYKGEIDLSDVKLRDDACDKLRLPVRLILGRIQKLYLKVPWNALSSSPVQLEVRGLHLVIAPLDKTKWNELLERQRSLELLQKHLLEHAVTKLHELIAVKRLEQGAKGQTDEEKEGFLVNMLTKIVDNLQILIKGIHVRYEDVMFGKEPLSMGITLEKFQAKTTNEKWAAEFIDRTRAANKFKPIQKHIELGNIGLYCKPRDERSQMISLIEDPAERLAKFKSMFREDEQLCTLYDACYILRPISIEARVKQLSNHLPPGAKEASEPQIQLKMNVNKFQIAFLKSQFTAVIKFFENVHEFQMHRDNFLNQQRANVASFYQSPELFAKKKKLFLDGLLLQVVREVKVLAYEGKTIPKKELQEIDEAAIISNKLTKEAYEKFVKFENMLLLKGWADGLVKDEFERLEGLLYSQKQEDAERTGGGLIGYIGSWLGGALGGAGSTQSSLPAPDKSQIIQSNKQTAPPLKPQAAGDRGTVGEDDDGDDSFDEADFYDAVEEHTNQIERASVQIYNHYVQSAAASTNADSLQAPADSLAKVSLSFALDIFQLSLIDDSNVFDINDPSQQESRYLYEYNEILTELRGLSVDFKLFDTDNPKNPLESEARAHIVDMNLTYVQEVNAADNSKLVVKKHKIIRRRDAKQDLVDVSFCSTNKKLKQLKQDAMSPALSGMSMSSRSQGQQPDQELTARLRTIYFEYRKEYIEFFMTFFASEEAVKDELKLKALEEYEKLREAVSVAALLEQREKMTSTVRLSLEVENIMALFPIYGYKGDAMQASETVKEKPLSPNYLFDLTSKPTWLAVTGPVRLGNYEDSLKIPGISTLSLSAAPSLVFSENMADFWKHEDPAKLTAVLHNCFVKSSLKIKDAEHKFDDPYAVPEFAMDFHLPKANISLTPLVYCHLLNIVDVFVRPQAASGDIAKLRYNERRHIFDNVRRISLVRKRGNTLHYWYDYIAVFSGSYIYFYPPNSQQLLELATKQREKINFLENIDYEEYFLLKGCNKVRNYQDYKDEQEKRRLAEGARADVDDQDKQINSKEGAGGQVRLENSMGYECIIEFQNEAESEQWKKLVVSKAEEIDQFLKKDQFQFGNFGQSLSADKLQTAKMQELILSEQLDRKNNFDALVKDDPLQVQQGYVICVEQVSVVLEGFTKVKLGSRHADRESLDNLILTPKVPHQFNKDASQQQEERIQFFLEARTFYLGFFYREYDAEMTVSLKSIQVYDRTPMLGLIDKYRKDPAKAALLRGYCSEIDDALRYQALFTSKPSAHHSNLVKVVMKRAALKSPFYNDVEMELSIALSSAQMNYHPIATNRLIRFLRVYRSPAEEMEQYEVTIKQTLKIRLQERQRGDQGSQDDAGKKSGQKDGKGGEPQDIQPPSKPADSIISVDKFQRRVTCHDDRTKVVVVKVVLEQLKLVCIHPQNDSYPVFTAKASGIECEYEMHRDHDTYSGHLENFKILDNTRYPNTLPPLSTYPPGSKVHSQLLLGFTDPSQTALTFKITWFHFPLDFSCPLQTSKSENKQFSGLVNLHLRSAKLNYQQEYFMRFLGYFLYQLIESVGDTNPYEEMRERLTRRLDPFAATGGQDAPVDVESKKSAKGQLLVDLRQVTQVTGLDMTIENPLIILKDRPYLPTSMRFDLGLIIIRSRTEAKCGRWAKQPKREVLVNSLLFEARSMRVDCLTRTGTSQVMPPFDLLIDYESINSSPLLAEGHLSPGFDFHDLQIQEIITIKTIEPSLEMRFRPSVYTYLMRCLDLNVNFVDEFDAHFQFYEWNCANTMRQYNLWQQIVKQFKGTTLKRRVIKFLLPCLSVKCLNEQSSILKEKDPLLAELLLCSTEIEYQQFLDTRATINVRSNNCFVLYKEREDGQHRTIPERSLRDANFKTVLLGPFSSPRNVYTDRKFYSGQAVMAQSDPNFALQAILLPDGGKKMDAELCCLKLFLRLDLIYLLQHFFQSGLPSYEGKRDRPSYFDADPRKYPRWETNLRLLDSVIIFEQLTQRATAPPAGAQPALQSAKPSGQKGGTAQGSSQPAAGSTQTTAKNNYFTQTVAFQGEVLVSYVREKEQSTKVDLVQKFVNKSAELARERSQGQIDSSSAVEKQDAEQDQARGQGTTPQLPNQAYLIQILNVSPFLCYIEDLDEGVVPRPLSLLTQAKVSKPLTAATKPTTTSDNALKNIWKRQLLSAPCLFQYSTSEVIELQTSRKQVQALKGTVTRLVAAGEKHIPLAKYEPSADELSNSDDNFKFCWKVATELGLAELHLTFNDLIVIKGVARQFQLLNSDAERRIQKFEELRTRKRADGGKSDDGGGSEARQVEGARSVVLEVDEEMAESQKDSVVRDGGSELGADGEEDMVDYDQEDLDSDEEQDFESAESGSSDGDSFYGDQSAGRRAERVGGASVIVAAKLDGEVKLDEVRKQSAAPSKNVKQASVAGTTKKAQAADEDECDFGDSDGSEGLSSPGKGVQKINESRPSNLNVRQHQKSLMQSTKGPGDKKGEPRTGFKEAMRTRMPPAGQRPQAATKAVSSVCLRREDAEDLKPDRATLRKQKKSKLKLKSCGPGAGALRLKRDAGLVELRAERGKKNALILVAERPEHQRGINETKYSSKGLKLLLINDRDSNFLPIVSLNSSPFEVIWTQNLTLCSLTAQLRLSVNFFNMNMGCWEPFLERFGFALLQLEDYQSKMSSLDLNFGSPINMNMTEKLVENVQESYKSWKICQEDYKLFEQQSTLAASRRLQQEEDSILETELLQLSSSLLEEDNPYAPRLSVVDQRLRQTLRKQSSKGEGADGQAQAAQSTGAAGGKPTEKQGGEHGRPDLDIITPYVIVNKTDLTVVAHRLQRRATNNPRQAFQDALKAQIEQEIVELAEGRPSDTSTTAVARQSAVAGAASEQQPEKKKLTNMYKIQQGQIVDYMVDYGDRAQREYDAAMRDPSTMADGEDSDEERIHSDQIGEYKSEYIRVKFDKTSAELPVSRELFDDNKEIKQVDLNELGYNVHILREGQYREKIFYGSKIIDSKKVFTVRSQYQLVNFTGFDYLINFAFGKKSRLLKYLESGDSLPLSRRFDDCSIQIKMIDDDVLKELKAKNTPIDEKTGHYQLPEFQKMKRDPPADFRDAKLGFGNWSALIPVRVLKERLGMEESSYLTNAKSKYTFIKKTRSEIMSIERAIDINLMPPVVICNCLPFKLTMRFIDSSDAPRTVTLEKEDEKNLFCFSMAKTITVDLEVPDFLPVKDYKLFNLEKFRLRESKIWLEDRQGRTTTIYTLVQKKPAGQRVIFYCKKILVDSIDSDLQYYYKKPSLITKNEDPNRFLVPFVNQGLVRQKIFILPEEEGYQQVHAALASAPQDSSKLEIDTISSVFLFTAQDRHVKLNFCYSSSVFLATPSEYIYTKVTTVAPQQIVVNQSKRTVIIEQALLQAAVPPAEADNYVPMILEPGQRQAFNFYLFPPREGAAFQLTPAAKGDSNVEELLRLRLVDEAVPFQGPDGKAGTATKQYKWSCAFEIATVQQFSLLIPTSPPEPEVLEQVCTVKDPKEKERLIKELHAPKQLKVICKTDLGGDTIQGSVFAVIRDVREDQCEYYIRNESKRFTMHYAQHIVTPPSLLKIQPLLRAEVDTQEEWLPPAVGGHVEQVPFAWASLVHDKLLGVSLTAADRSEKLALCDLTAKQLKRAVVPDKKKERFIILVPLDKIGHNDPLTLALPVSASKTQAVLGRVNVCITTDGTSKILSLKDQEQEEEEQNQKEQATDESAAKVDRPEALLSTGLRAIGSIKQAQSMEVKHVQLRIDSVCLSLIHRKRELATVFVAQILTEVTESLRNTAVKFSIGYLQIDNQWEAEPAYAVIIRPRDLFYTKGKITFELEHESEKERQEREAQGLSNLTEETAKMFQSQVILNNEARRHNDVVHIDSIVFLVQTLQIKIQFSHLLKVVSFFYSLSKILNKSVTRMHYLFESDEKYELTGGSHQQITGIVGTVEEVPEPASSKPLPIDYQDHAMQKKKERLRTFVKQDVAIGSKVRQGQNKKVEAAKMSTTESNWQFSSKVVSQSKWKIFIKTYQSSPLELVVSAINERFKRDRKAEEQKKAIADGNNPAAKTAGAKPVNADIEKNRLALAEKGLAQDDDGALSQEDEDEVIGLVGARDEQLARRFLYFSTFEDMLFQVNGINITNVFGEGNEVVRQLLAYHRDSIKYSALAVLGSSNLIGNPAKFVNGVGTGVSDFFVKPYQGMQDGSFVKAAGGFAQGSKSLLKNAVLAPVGAVSKIGSSLSKGAVALSFDDTFIHEKNRRDLVHKPKHVGDGLVKGFSSAGTSLWSGVAGLVRQPYEGAREEGVGGFIVGVGKGAAGLVTKTVSGAVDIVAKTAEGIDNHAKGSERLLLASLKMRNPRPFYETTNLIRPYNRLHANWLTALPLLYTKLELKNVYELFRVLEAPRHAVVNKTPAFEAVCHVFVLTRDYIIHFKHTTITHRETPAEQQPETPGAATPAPSEAPADSDELEKLQPAFEEIVASAHDLKIKFEKDGSGTQLQIMQVFVTRHLEFIEIISEKVLMLGWRSDQTNNFFKDANEQPAACNQEIIRPNTGTARFTQEQLSRVKEELFRRHLEQMEAIRTSQIGYQNEPEVPRVLAGRNYLQIDFDTARQARRAQIYLEKIKAILRKEKARQLAHQQWVNIKV